MGTGMAVRERSNLKFWETNVAIANWALSAQASGRCKNSLRVHFLTNEPCKLIPSPSPAVDLQSAHLNSRDRREASGRKRTPHGIAASEAPHLGSFHQVCQVVQRTYRFSVLHETRLEASPVPPESCSGAAGCLPLETCYTTSASYDARTVLAIRGYGHN
ncbi:hypothetical protein VTK26DRAFT_6265 [Humicola hyalothermophila]